MPRNMSFFLTQRQYLARTKDVTRRLGWKRIHAGEIQNGVVKGQGLRKGEKITVLGQHQVLSSRWEPLRMLLDDLEYGRAEVIREGFPDLTPAEFVEMFCQHNHCTPEQIVNRIEFRRL